jgi:hemerythrin-like domain-containing protein
MKLLLQDAIPKRMLPTNKLNQIYAQYTQGANGMCYAHLGLIRHLNSIYLQAPSIPVSFQPAFLRYIQSFTMSLTSHHSGEESLFFPALEAATQIPGLMGHEVEQHHSFEGPLEELEAYIVAIQEGKDPYDGAKIRAQIRAFAPGLVEHLQDELVTLSTIPARLPKNVDPASIPLEKMLHELAVHSSRKMSLTTDVFSFVLNSDKSYDGGRYKDHPPFPAALKAFLNYVVPWLEQSYCRFASCDSLGRPREMEWAPLLSEWKGL